MPRWQLPWRQLFNVGTAAVFCSEPVLAMLANLSTPEAEIDVVDNRLRRVMLIDAMIARMLFNESAIRVPSEDTIHLVTRA